MILGALIFLLTAGALAAAPTNTFVVAAYNVENWVLMERDGQPNQPKPESEKAAVVDVLATIQPDVLGVVELGTTNELAELSRRLAARGLHYPHSEWIQGWDVNRHVALLSRFPITERHSRTDYSYQLGTNTLYHSRGVLDVQIQVTADYSFRTVVAHLKSRRQHELFDDTLMRHAEARLLREHVARALAADPARNLILMGDLNDPPESESLRVILGQPPGQLRDLMPQDRAGRFNTHLWRFRRQWSRIDYLLVSTGMANDYVAGSARIADEPGWDRASDHRAVYARFTSVETAPVPAAETAPTGAGGIKPRLLIIGVVAAVLVLDGLLVLWILSRRQSPARR